MYVIVYILAIKPFEFASCEYCDTSIIAEIHGLPAAELRRSVQTCGKTATKKRRAAGPLCKVDIRDHCIAWINIILLCDDSGVFRRC